MKLTFLLGALTRCVMFLLYVLKWIFQSILLLSETGGEIIIAEKKSLPSHEQPYPRYSQSSVLSIGPEFI